VRGAFFCVKWEGVKIDGVDTGRIPTGTRHARPDGQRSPGALRSVQALRPIRTLRPIKVLVLSVIAGMAHSTLKSGAATRNGVAWGIN
jgi:hypothetical protein